MQRFESLVFWKRAVAVFRARIGNFGFNGNQRNLELMRVTLKTVNDALAQQGSEVRLAKGSSYFYFDSGEATEWLERRCTYRALAV